jgi:hypothetical protein
MLDPGRARRIGVRHDDPAYVERSRPPRFRARRPTRARSRAPHSPRGSTTARRVAATPGTSRAAIASRSRRRPIE